MKNKWNSRSFQRSCFSRIKLNKARAIKNELWIFVSKSSGKLTRLFPTWLLSASCSWRLYQYCKKMSLKNYFKNLFNYHILQFNFSLIKVNVLCLLYQLNHTTKIIHINIQYFSLFENLNKYLIFYQRPENLTLSRS